MFSQPSKTHLPTGRGQSSACTSTRFDGFPPPPPPAAAEEAEGGYTYELTSIRNNFREKLREKLLVGHSGGSLYRLAETIEAEVNTWATVQRGDTQKEYQNKCRALISNLRKNDDLRREIRTGAMPPQTLVGLTNEELAPKEKKAAKAQMVQQLQDQSSLDYHKRKDVREAKLKACGIEKQVAMYTCFKCGSKQIEWSEKQTRSADEPMTQFYKCMDCGNAWRN